MAQFNGSVATDEVFITVAYAVALHALYVKVFFLFFAGSHQVDVDDFHAQAVAGFRHGECQRLVRQAVEAGRIHFGGQAVTVPFFPFVRTGIGSVPGILLVGQRCTPQVEAERGAKQFLAPYVHGSQQSVVAVENVTETIARYGQFVSLQLVVRYTGRAYGLVRREAPGQFQFVPGYFVSFGCPQSVVFQCGRKQQTVFLAGLDVGTLVGNAQFFASLCRRGRMQFARLENGCVFFQLPSDVVGRCIGEKVPVPYFYRSVLAVCPGK